MNDPLRVGQVMGGVHQPLLLADGDSPCLADASNRISYRACREWVARARDCLMGDCGGESVAIWMDKGTLYARTILAALFAGARYLPIDGSQPVDRARAIVDDGQPRLLVLDSEHARKWVGSFRHVNAGPAVDGPRLLVLSDESMAPWWPDINGRSWQATSLCDCEATGALEVEPVNPAATAAILYTSGSTGKPKGVQLSHRNLANFVGWARATLDIGDGDRLLNVASFNFDLSTFDLFSSLLAGASVYVTSESELGQVSRVRDLIGEESVSVLYAVPSLYSLLLRVGPLAPVAASLRRVVFAGEVMPKRVLGALAQALPPDCRLYNFYGPTETNVCAWHQVGKADLGSPDPLPIGRPIDQTEIWLVGDDGRRVHREGEVGEIWVSGTCVTPGYWHRPADPNTTNHRLGVHATGDYGAWSNGCLTYHGRKDRMLKILGYRVELGEVETALLRHPAVVEAVVIARDQGGVTRLSASYVTGRSCADPGPFEIRSHCASLLPVYMVPQQIRRLDALPRNANGKVDIRAVSEMLARAESA